MIKILLDKNKDLLKVLLIIILQYIVFFTPIFNPNNALVGNFTTDARSLHYPSRYYLYERLKNHEFPFWTERIYSGFPIYADLERGYLNPANIILTYTLGPVNSFKVLHFSFYAAGAFGLYFLLKRKDIGLAGFFVANTIFYFSLYNMVKQELFNSIFVIYLIPLSLYYSEIFLESRKLKYAGYNALTSWFLLTFGQINFLVIFLLIKFIYFFAFALKKVSWKSVFQYIATFSFILTMLSLPVILPAYQIFKGGVRYSSGFDYLEGSFPPILVLNGLFPFIWGTPSKFIGELLNSEYLFNEVHFYAGISALIFAIIGIAAIKNKREKIFLFLLFLVFILLSFIRSIPILNTDGFLPLTAFRYWGRASIYFVFAVSYGAAFFTENLSKQNAIH